jgi:hypothetical protein
MTGRNAAEQAFIVDYLQKTQTRLKVGADDGILRIIKYGYQNNYSTAEIAYNLATAGHETAYWYQPIREGATRFGPNYTDAQSRAAVQSALASGRIKKDYVRPINGRSYYGRGLVQITWIDNYKKYEDLTGRPLVLQPDLALDWEIALFIMYDGINKGRFRKRKFSDYVKPDAVPTHMQYSQARDIVNGDASTVGAKVGRDSLDWYVVLRKHDAALKASYAPTSDGWFGLLIALFKGWKGMK